MGRWGAGSRTLKSGGKPGNARLLRGQVFTIDALLSVAIVLIFTAATLNFSLSIRHTRGSIHDEKLADDVLVMLDGQGFLQQNISVVNRSIDSLLRNTRQYRAEMYHYEANGGTFVLVANESAGPMPENFTEVSASERSIAAYGGLNDSRIANFIKVRLYVWR